MDGDVSERKKKIGSCRECVRTSERKPVTDSERDNRVVREEPREKQKYEKRTIEKEMEGREKINRITL